MNPYIKDFPILDTKTNSGKPLVYLDNAATTQKPWAVLEAESFYYQKANANPHRGSYDLSIAATTLWEETRQKTKAFIHGNEQGEVIFTKNATESLNLVAMSYGRSVLKEGDEVLIAISEHHSNLVPWQVVTREKKAILRYMYTTQEGVLEPEEIRKKVNEHTKIIAIGHVSNVTGYINPVEVAIEEGHKVGAVVVVDGTQSVPHMPVDVAALDADFYAFSCHKMLAPMGIGVLYGKKAHLEEMPPYQYGGDMIEYVEEQETTYAPIPQKFEAGTQNLGSAAGLGAAIDYLNAIGMEQVCHLEEELTVYLLEKLQNVPHVKLLGPLTPERKIGVAAFNMEGIHPHDVATIVNQDGIAIRSGHHCAQPLHKFLQVPSSCRASVYLYNTKEEIDQLCDSLKHTRRWLGYES